MMRLRLVKGLDFEEYKARFGRDFSQGRQARIRKLKQMAFITGDAAGLRLDPRAYFISNAVIAELL
jgi:coproporphyrinogen III oxidase-like Fe-S oxidoreductase